MEDSFDGGAIVGTVAPGATLTDGTPIRWVSIRTSPAPAHSTAANLTFPDTSKRAYLNETGRFVAHLPCPHVYDGEVSYEVRVGGRIVGAVSAFENGEFVDLGVLDPAATSERNTP
jgi:hypothetical protein